MLQKNQTKNLAVRICVEALRTGIRHLIDQLLGRAQEGTQEQQISDIAKMLAPPLLHIKENWGTNNSEPQPWRASQQLGRGSGEERASREHLLMPSDAVPY